MLAPYSSRLLRFAQLAAAAFAWAMVAGCSDALRPEPSGSGAQRAEAASPVEVTAQARAVARTSNQFAFELYDRLRGAEGNLFFSPASISTALAMTYAGAEGETRRQMAEALHFDLPPEELNAGFATLNQVLLARDGRHRLDSANRLWGQASYKFRPEFLKTTRRYFGAELAPLDFTQSERARQTINDWVEQQTQGKIVELLPPGVLDEKTRLVLTNAIYFKAGWEHEFVEALTADAPFLLSKQEQIETPTMQQSNAFLYEETPQAQLLEMPYAGGDLAMVVLLPKELDGLADLEAELSEDKLRQWLAEGEYQEVEASLPKFQTTSQFMLSEPLKALGMPLAFSDQADFSGMSAAEGLKISDVVHKAFVDVNEAGTEAAAATGVAVKAAAAPATHVVFRADHPFVFLIRDLRTEAILFLGRIIDPR